MSERSVLPQGAGGTPGGFGTFFLGLALAGGGGYLILNQVTVLGSLNIFARFGLGGGGFGLTLLPLLIGVGFLFYDGKSAVGWIVTVMGAAMIVGAILMNMSIFFRPTSLFNTILMFGMFVGGLGLIVRSLRASPAGADRSGEPDAVGKSQEPAGPEKTAKKA